MEKVTREVGLFGTCNESPWRKELMEKVNNDTLVFFDPTDIDEWNDEAIEREEQKKKTCPYLIYVITPEMKGMYSIVEMTYSFLLPNQVLVKVPKLKKGYLSKNQIVIICILKEYNGYKFDESQQKSVDATIKLLKDSQGTYVFNKTVFNEETESVNSTNYIVDSLDEIAKLLNAIKIKEASKE